MANLYVKDVSRLTKVSVQTLHHYDRIGLLKPSIRLDNGYRQYTTTDLLKLQQIVALKYFGFSLSQIKTLLKGDTNMRQHLALQSHFLEEKAATLRAASQTLNKILSECSEDKSFSWETILKLIEVYHMTQNLEKSWQGKTLNPAELKEYAGLMNELRTRFSPKEEQDYQNRWTALIKEVDANINNDPSSQIGIDIGRRCMEWVNALYGKKHAALRKAVWDKGFKKGDAGPESSMSAETIAWLDRAIFAFQEDRAIKVLATVGTQPEQVVLQQWEEIMTDLCGDDRNARKEAFDFAMKLEKVSPAAKAWLKKISTA